MNFLFTDHVTGVYEFQYQEFKMSLLYRAHSQSIHQMVNKDKSKEMTKSNLFAQCF